MQSQYKPGSYAKPAAQILLSAPAAITKLVIAFTIAAVAGVVTGNQSCFASDQSSPDKQWEYQSSDEGEKSQIVKAGTTQIVRFWFRLRVREKPAIRSHLGAGFKALCV